MQNAHVTATPDCANAHADPDRPDVEEMPVKAQLALSIARLIEGRGLSQVRAARRIGLSQPKLSDMINGKFRGISEAKMLECITRLGRDIRIVIHPNKRPENIPGHIEVWMEH